MGAAVERSDDQSFVDLSTAARRLGVSRQGANLLVLEGQLPARRWGQRWMVDKDDLEQFAATYQPVRRGAKPPLRPEHLQAVLRLLAEQPGISALDVAESLGRPRRTVLGWMQYLDREGLVKRRREEWDPKDPAHCYLTDAGQAFYKELPHTV
jgi:excisionase family DNA binding protein